MDPEQWARVKAHFDEWLALDPAARRDRLAGVPDPAVRREVEELLVAHDTAGGFLEQPFDVDPRDLEEGVAGGAPAPSRHTLPPGTRVGDYEIRREIGRGGMGIVYLAHDVHLARPVALKALPSEAGRDERLLERFRREAQAAAAVSHPAVALVYALVDTPGGPFIASEFVDGQTLREELRQGPLAASRAVAIATAIVEALVAAHDARVVHRDLKPENVLLTASGTVKVIDFGIARIGGSGAAAATAPGVLQGTPGYMAPEQLVSGATLDERVDIYALGVILAEMLLGEHPMGRGTRGLPAGLSEIVRRCLDSDRERRYQSARDLLRDLERVGEARTGESPERVVDRARRRTRRWWEFHQAATVFVYAAMAAPAWYAREIIGGVTGRTLFFMTLVSLVIASILRLHLFFTARTHPLEFASQWRHEHRWIRMADVLFALSLLTSGGLVGDSRMSLAVLLVAVAVGAAVVSAFVEPSTTRAAFGEMPRMSGPAEAGPHD
jgi:hypothetical protein